MDDTATYTREYTEEGEAEIVSENGETLELTEGEILSFIDGNDAKVTVNTVTGVKTVETEEETVTYETVEVPLEEETSGWQTLTDQEKDAALSEEKTASGMEELKEAANSGEEPGQNGVTPSRREGASSEDATAAQSTVSSKNGTIKSLLCIGLVLLVIVVAILLSMDQKGKVKE